METKKQAIPSKSYYDNSDSHHLRAKLKREQESKAHKRELVDEFGVDDVAEAEIYKRFIK